VWEGGKEREREGDRERERERESERGKEVMRTKYNFFAEKSEFCQTARTSFR